MSHGLLNEHEAARFMNLSVNTLRAWRLQRRGPVFLKLGKAVRYRPEDLEDFLKDSMVEPI